MPSDEHLPLQELFQRLRRVGLSIGLEEYRVVLQALQRGVGLENREALARLCRTVWVKSAAEQKLFDYHFEQIFDQPVKPFIEGGPATVQDRWLAVIGAVLMVLVSVLVIALPRIDRLTRPQPTVTQPAPEQPGSPGTTPETSPQPPNKSSTTPNNGTGGKESPNISPSDAPRPVPTQPTISMTDTMVGLILVSCMVGLLMLLIYKQRRGIKSANVASLEKLLHTLPQQVTAPIQDELEVVNVVNWATDQPGKTGAGRFVTTADYFPVTQRQMKQSWRYLRRMVREGPAIELDVAATVDHIGRQGQLLQPVLRPRLRNRAELLILIDQEGSMAPFQGLAQRLVHTAMQGGRLRHAGVYFFHNCPRDYLYGDPEQQTFARLTEVLGQVRSDYAGLFIFSDAGAGHGRFCQQRLQQTKLFLDQVRQQVRYIAWLNPMPQERWVDSTAAAVAQLIPMFEFNRQGLEGAIATLRGQIRR